MKNAKSPLVSAIIASYNHSAYVTDSITSVLRQTYPNIELIVIDDGSSDDSVTRIKPLAEKHKFYFAAQENMGLARTLNKAISMARGKYFAALGSDDIAMLDKTEKQVAFMEVHPGIAVCGGNVLNINDEGVILKKQKLHPYRELDFESIMTNKPGIASPTAMIRKSVLDEAGDYDPDIQLEDMSMWLKLTYQGYRIAGLNDVLVYYRKHTANTYRDYEFMYRNMMKTYAPYRDHPLYEPVVNRYRNSALIALAKRGNKAFARKVLQEINPRYYKLKTLRGLMFLLRPKFVPRRKR